jgi:hypothetical protein
MGKDIISFLWAGTDQLYGAAEGYVSSALSFITAFFIVAYIYHRFASNKFTGLYICKQKMKERRLYIIIVILTGNDAFIRKRKFLVKAIYHAKGKILEGENIEMDNILSYIKWRGDISFAERPFNEVDNLVLAMLSYIDFSGLIPEIHEKGFALLKEVPTAILKEPGTHGYKTHSLLDLPLDFLKETAASKRFGNCKLYHYMDTIDEQRKIQFAGLHVELGDGTVYIAFRGTDQTILGWREDFTISFETVPAQLEAVDYLEKTISRNAEKKYRVGGHSKGGNLAVYASAMCSDSVKDQIIEIYDNDGPGFQREILKTEQYDGIRDKIIRIIPSYSIIGMLFEHDGPCKIVSSAAEGIMQHDGMTWEVEGEHFIKAEGLKKECKVINQIFDMWIEEVDMEQRRIFTENFFDALEAGGAKHINEIANRGVGGFESILTAMVTSSRDSKAVVGKLFKTCISSARKIDIANVWKTKKVIRGTCIALFGLLFMQLPEHGLQIVGTAAVFLLMAFAGQRLIYNSKIEKEEGIVKKHIGIFYTVIVLFGLILVLRQKALIFSTNFSLGIILIGTGGVKLKQIIKAPVITGRFQWVPYAYALLSVILGIVALVGSSKVMDTFVFTIGTFLIIEGFREIVMEIYKLSMDHAAGRRY